MVVLFVLMGLASWGFAVLMFLVAKSAIHEAVVGLLVLNGTILVVGANVCSAIESCHNALQKLGASPATRPSASDTHASEKPRIVETNRSR